MRIVLLFLIAIFVPSLANARVDHGICDSLDAKQILEKEVAKENNKFDLAIFNQITLGKQVILVGDTHFYTDVTELRNLITQFAKVKGANSCIAFEFTQQAETGENFLELVKKAVPELEALLRDTNLMFQEKESVQDSIKNFKSILSYYGPLVRVALESKLQTRAIDHIDHPFEEAKSDDERNHAMAREISRLLQVRQCSSILALVGKAHLSRAFGSKTRIQDLIFTNGGYDSVSINVQMTRETVPELGRTWTSCEAPTINEPVILPRLFTDRTLRIMPKIYNSPLWSDYDFTLLLPR